MSPKSVPLLVRMQFWKKRPFSRQKVQFSSLKIRK